jgi:hypothetical protein
MFWGFQPRDLDGPEDEDSRWYRMMSPEGSEDWGARMRSIASLKSEARPEGLVSH